MLFRKSSLLKIVLPLFIFTPFIVFASDNKGLSPLNLVSSPIGIICVVVFCLAYLAVMFEEKLHMKKSKPVIGAAGLIWLIIAGAHASNNLPTLAEEAVRHNLLEFVELMLFLMVAMTYINALIERGVFEKLRTYLISLGLNFRQLFWITGFIAFFLSPIADNLTTALIMCAVILAFGEGNKKFVSVCCVNIVVAANAGGAFSPFGDITTLMVWQKGIVEFSEFFVLFIPSLVNFLVPAFFMSFAISKDRPKFENKPSEILRGGYVIIVLFLMTITTAVLTHNVFHLPPAIGMMFGLSYLMIYGYYLKMTSNRKQGEDEIVGIIDISNISFKRRKNTFDTFHHIAAAEWDTLLFFFGVILCVGGLGFIGYLAILSEIFYIGYGATIANISVGILSAILDNIPVMFSVLTITPEMSHNQWLLVTLTAGVGGSLLSIGSAAGVALMGQSKGAYTFGSHLKWTPFILLGYFASIGSHLLINGF